MFLAKKRKLVLHYYKNPKLLENNVRIIYSSFDTLELWKFSNLTFGGNDRYHTSTLCKVFFFFFVVQVLSRAREDHVAY